MYTIYEDGLDFRHFSFDLGFVVFVPIFYKNLIC